LGQSADGLGWVGSHKMDPRTTLDYPGQTVQPTHLWSVLLYCMQHKNKYICLRLKRAVNVKGTLNRKFISRIVNDVIRPSPGQL